MCIRDRTSTDNSIQQQLLSTTSTSASTTSVPAAFHILHIERTTTTKPCTTKGHSEATATTYPRHNYS